MCCKGNDHITRCGSRPPVAYLFHALALPFIFSATLSAQATGTREATLPSAVAASPDPVTVEIASTLAARLSAPGLKPDQRERIIRELEARREALMDEYLAAYRKTIRDNHWLHPEDPWLASEKIGQALRSKTQMIEQHNQIADLLDEHAPFIRPDSSPQLRTHLSKLPAAHREFFEATQAALGDSPAAFQAIAAAQSRLQAEIAKDPARDPDGASLPLRDTPQRQAHLRRLHQELIESKREGTPPLAEFLQSQDISRFSAPSVSNTAKP